MSTSLQGSFLADGQVRVPGLTVATAADEPTLAHRSSCATKPQQDIFQLFTGLGKLQQT